MRDMKIKEEVSTKPISQAAIRTFVNNEQNMSVKNIYNKLNYIYNRRRKGNKITKNITQ